MTFVLGMKIVSLKGENDHDENDQPRSSPPGSVGEVVSLEVKDGLVTCGVVFPEGTWVFLDEKELASGDYQLRPEEGITDPVINRCPVSYQHMPHDYCDGTPSDTRKLPAE